MKNKADMTRQKNLNYYSEKAMIYTWRGSMVCGILVERSQRMERWPSSSSCMEVIGQCRIGVNKAHLSNTQGAHMLWFVGKDVFSDVVHFVLLNSPRPRCGMEEAPSPWWGGGEVSVAGVVAI